MRVEFPCTFHGKPALGKLTLERDRRFVANFTQEELPKVTWVFSGTWTLRPTSIVELETQHGYAKVTLIYHADRTLTGLRVDGGFVDLNVVGSRSTPLPEDLYAWVRG